MQSPVYDSKHAGESDVKDCPTTESQFGLSLLGYYRNVVLQHDRPCGRGPAPSVDIKANENTIATFWRSHLRF